MDPGGKTYFLGVLISRVIRWRDGFGKHLLMEM